MVVVPDSNFSRMDMGGDDTQYFMKYMFMLLINSFEHLFIDQNNDGSIFQFFRALLKKERKFFKGNRELYFFQVSHFLQ